MNTLNNCNKCDDIEEQLMCAICRDVMYQPITLLCQHNACKHCLLSLKENRCPHCRLRFVIPKEYNRTLDAICSINQPEQYQVIKKSRATNKDKHIQDIKSQLKDEFYNEIVNTELEQFEKEAKQTTLSGRLLETLISPDTINLLNNMKSYLKLFSFILLLNISVFVLTFESWRHFPQYTSYLQPLILLIDLPILTLFIWGLILTKLLTASTNNTRRSNERFQFINTTPVIISEPINDSFRSNEQILQEMNRISEQLNQPMTDNTQPREQRQPPIVDFGFRPNLFR